MSPESKCLFTYDGNCALQKWVNALNSAERKIRALNKTTQINRLYEDAHQANGIIQGSACSNCPHPERSRIIFQNITKVKEEKIGV